MQGFLDWVEGEVEMKKDKEAAQRQRGGSWMLGLVWEGFFCAFE